MNEIRIKVFFPLYRKVYFTILADDIPLYIHMDRISDMTGVHIGNRNERIVYEYVTGQRLNEEKSLKYNQAFDGMMIVIV